MKFILWIMLGLLLFQANHAYASHGQLKATMGTKVEMIPFSMATGATKTHGFKTYTGQLIPLNQIKNMGTGGPVAMGKVVVDGLLELRSGDIFYSEELEYVVAPKGEFTGASSLIRFNPRIGRAPHTPK